MGAEASSSRMLASVLSLSYNPTYDLTPVLTAFLVYSPGWPQVLILLSQMHVTSLHEEKALKSRSLWVLAGGSTGTPLPSPPIPRFPMVTKEQPLCDKDQ